MSMRSTQRYLGPPVSGRSQTPEPRGSTTKVPTANSKEGSEGTLRPVPQTVRLTHAACYLPC